MKPLPKKAAKEAQAAYIERVFKHLYGNQKRVKVVKPRADSTVQSGM